MRIKGICRGLQDSPHAASRRRHVFDSIRARHPGPVSESRVIPQLDESRVAFLTGPVAISVASRDGSLTPSLARAYGCRVSADRRTVILFLSTARSESLLRDLRAAGPVAAVFTRPKTHQSMQLKATRADIRPLSPGDRELMHGWGANFDAEIRALGYKAHFADAFRQPTHDDAVAVEFMPTAVFEQTPGPGAGKRLGPGS